MSDVFIYLSDMADLVGRKPHTIRQWIAQEKLSDELMPKREDGRGRLYWVPAQVDGMKAFAERMSRRQGWGYLVEDGR